MTDISLDLEKDELKEIDLTVIEKKMPLPGNVSDIMIEMKRKNILENIKELNSFEHQEIFKIVKKYNIRYSENSNGIFINMNKLGKRPINEIDKFINYCNSNKKLFIKENTIRKNLKDFVETKISQEKKEDNIGVKKYNDTEEKIEKGISYKSDSCEEDNLEDIEDVDCSSKTKTNVKFNFDNDFEKKIIDDLNII